MSSEHAAGVDSFLNVSQTLSVGLSIPSENFISLTSPGIVHIPIVTRHTMCESRRVDSIDDIPGHVPDSPVSCGRSPPGGYEDYCKVDQFSALLLDLLGYSRNSGPSSLSRPRALPPLCVIAARAVL